MADLNNVESELRDRVQWVIDQAPQVFEVTTGWRSMAEQQRLWNAYQKALKEHPKDWQKYAALAAKPGTSKHGMKPSQAVDLACPPAHNELRTMLAQKASLATPVNGEPWHLELAASRKNIPARPVSNATIEKHLKLITIEAVATVPSPLGAGAWTFGARGHVYAHNPAPYLGGWDDGTRGNPDRRCVGLIPTTSGQGYFLLSSFGEVYSYGDAVYCGNYRAEWGQGTIVGGIRNDHQTGGGVTMIRDDGVNLNAYDLP